MFGKIREKNNPSGARPCRIWKSHPRGRNSTNLFGIATPRVKFDYTSWTLMMDSYIFS